MYVDGVWFCCLLGIELSGWLCACVRCIVTNKKTKTKGSGKRCREYMVSTVDLWPHANHWQVALVREANIIKQKLPTTRSFKSTQSHIISDSRSILFSHTHAYIYIYTGISITHTGTCAYLSSWSRQLEFMYWISIRLINSLRLHFHHFNCYLTKFWKTVAWNKKYSYTFKSNL